LELVFIEHASGKTIGKTNKSDGMNTQKIEHGRERATKREVDEKEKVMYMVSLM
jgi:hypothetical protein